MVKHKPGPATPIVYVHTKSKMKGNVQDSEWEASVHRTEGHQAGVPTKCIYVLWEIMNLSTAQRNSEDDWTGIALLKNCKGSLLYKQSPLYSLEFINILSKNVLVTRPSKKLPEHCSCEPTIREK